MPGRKATFATCSSAWSWPITPSISSDAKIRPGTRIPALYSLGRSQRQSSIFWRMFFQMAAIAGSSDVEQDLGPVAPVLRRHLQHVPRDRLHADVALFGGADAAEVGHEAEHSGGGVGEQLLQGSGVRHDTRVGGVLQDLEGRARHEGASGAIIALDPLPPAQRNPRRKRLYIVERESGSDELTEKTPKRFTSSLTFRARRRFTQQVT